MEIPILVGALIVLLLLLADSLSQPASSPGYVVMSPAQGSTLNQGCMVLLAILILGVVIGTLVVAPILAGA